MFLPNHPLQVTVPPKNRNPLVVEAGVAARRELAALTAAESAKRRRVDSGDAGRAEVEVAEPAQQATKKEEGGLQSPITQVFFCNIRGCTRRFTSKKWFDRHQQNPELHSEADTSCTRRQLMVKLVQETQGVQTLTLEDCAAGKPKPQISTRPITTPHQLAFPGPRGGTGAIVPTLPANHWAKKIYKFPYHRRLGKEFPDVPMRALFQAMHDRGQQPEEGAADGTGKKKATKRVSGALATTMFRMYGQPQGAQPHHIIHIYILYIYIFNIIIIIHECSTPKMQPLKIGFDILLQS